MDIDDKKIIKIKFLAEAPSIKSKNCRDNDNNYSIFDYFDKLDKSNSEKSKDNKQI